MKKSVYTVFVIFALFFLLSCRKDSDLFIPYNSAIDSIWTSPIETDTTLNDLMDALSDPPYIDSLADIYAGDTIEWQEGVRIEIQGKSCIGELGNAATGNAAINLWLLTREGDFIRNLKPTSYHGNPIHTGAELYLQITQAGKSIQLAPGKYIIVSFPAPNPLNDLATHYPETPAGSPYLNWVLTQDGTYVNAFSRPNPGNPGQTITGYDVKLRQLNWVNAGKLTDTTNRTNITATLPSVFTNANTLVFVTFRDRNAVTQMKDDAASKIFSARNLPLNANIRVLSLSAIGHDYYLGTSEITVSTGQNVELKPEKKSLAEIREYLDKL